MSIKISHYEVCFSEEINKSTSQCKDACSITCKYAEGAQEMAMRWQFEHILSVVAWKNSEVAHLTRHIAEETLGRMY